MTVISGIMIRYRIGNSIFGLGRPSVTPSPDPSVLLSFGTDDDSWLGGRLCLDFRMHKRNHFAWLPRR